MYGYLDTPPRHQSHQNDKHFSHKIIIFPHNEETLNEPFQKVNLNFRHPCTCKFVVPPLGGLKPEPQTLCHIEKVNHFSGKTKDVKFPSPFVNPYMQDNIFPYMIFQFSFIQSIPV